MVNQVQVMKLGKYTGTVLQFDFGEFYCYGICVGASQLPHEESKSAKAIFIVRMLAPAVTEAVSGLNVIRNFPLRTYVRFHLGAMMRQPEVTNLGKVELSESELAEPTFKSLGLFAPGAKAKGWWLVNSKREDWVTSLTTEERRFPIDGVYGLVGLRELYDLDLSPESEIYFTNAPA